MYIYATDGTRYLDFLGGIAVNSAGHTHPRVLEAVERQVRRYMHVSNYFYQDAQVEFVERLCRMTGYTRAMLSNSGAEANEAALKFARARSSAQNRSRIVGFSGGFHGRTYGALSVMEKPLYKEGMGPFLPETVVIPFNDTEALVREVNDETCAVIIEFLQGEGGVHWASRPFVETLFQLRERHGFLVIADEVQAGAGRTGRFFSFEHFNVRPDIVTLAKGIGGGLPLGAMLVSEELAHVWTYGRHGTTFGGNAVACAAGNAVLELLEEGLMDQAASSGDYLQEQLRAIAREHTEIVVDVRGAGAIAGIELSIPAAPCVESMLRDHTIANVTTDTVIRLLPPLIFERSHIDDACRSLRRAMSTSAAQQPSTVGAEPGTSLPG